MDGHIAIADRVIAAPVERVWQLLTTAESHSAMMFGAAVDTDWRRGSPIVWSGEWQGRPFTDRGVIVAVERPDRLAVTHASGDGPDHAIEWRLTPDGDGTLVRVVQDGNASDAAAEEASQNWKASLDALADLAEG